MTTKTHTTKPNPAANQETEAQLKSVLSKFMAVTETSNEGITQMATVEGRAKFYDRVRVVRAEAHEIILHNA